MNAFYYIGYEKKKGGGGIQLLNVRTPSNGKLVLEKIVAREKEFSSVVTKLDVRHWLEGNTMDAGSRGIVNKRTKDALKGEEEDSRREPRLVPFP